ISADSKLEQGKDEFEGGIIRRLSQFSLYPLNQRRYLLSSVRQSSRTQKQVKKIAEKIEDKRKSRREDKRKKERFDGGLLYPREEVGEILANALEFVYENVDPMSLKRFHQMAYETTPKLLSSETYEHLMVRDPAVVDIHCILKEGERLLRRKHNAAMEPVTVKQLRGAFGDKFRDREWEYRNESTFVRIIVKEVEKMLQPQGKFAVLPFSGGGQDQMDISRDSVLVHQNSYIANQIVVVSNTYMDIEYQNSNSVLRAQLVALRDRLQSLNSVIKMSEGVMADVFLFTANTGLC
ncbi:unnamed protein product, partial [Brassica oleracea]